MTFKLQEFAGRTFERWTVISLHSIDGHGRSRWNCLCSCGVEKVQLRGNLIAGCSKSCGCLTRENRARNTPIKIDSKGYAAQGGRRMHIVVAERALGKPLPKGAQVHHVNEDKTDYSNSNLVICQDDAYHKLLHYRMQSLAASGHADWVKCGYCQQWSDPADPDLVNYSTRGLNNHIWHRRCQQEWATARHAKYLATDRCIGCGQSRGKNGGRALCRQCISKQLERVNARVAAGLCQHCSAERGTTGTSNLCRPCADKAAKSQMRYKRQKQERLNA